MNRLTFRDSKGELWIKDAAHIDEQGQICMLTDRLAAYEDIGLEPKQVRKIANVLQEVGQEYNCRFEFVAEVVEKYAKYVDAEREGRLVVLPENWSVGMINRIMSLCERARAMRIAKGKDDSPIITWQLYNMLAKSTRAEAEAALKGAEHE